MPKRFSSCQSKPTRFSDAHRGEVGCLSAGQDLASALPQVQPVTLHVHQHTADDAMTEEVFRRAVNRDPRRAPQRREDLGARPRHAIAVRLHAHKQNEPVVAERGHGVEHLVQRFVRDVRDGSP